MCDGAELTMVTRGPVSPRDCPLLLVPKQAGRHQGALLDMVSRGQGKGWAEDVAPCVRSRGQSHCATGCEAVRF